MSFEGAFEITCLKLPDFDGSVFGGGGELGVLRVEGQTGNVGFVPFQLEFRWCFEKVEIFKVDGGV